MFPGQHFPKYCFYRMPVLVLLCSWLKIEIIELHFRLRGWGFEKHSSQGLPCLELSTPNIMC